MDKDVEKDPTLTGDRESRGGKDNATESSRRRFTRNALVGGSVVLSLGNRSAWGQIGAPEGCLSVNHFASFDTGIVSLGPNQPENDAKYDDFMTILNRGVDPESPEGYVCPQPLELQSFDTEFTGPLTTNRSQRQMSILKEKNEKKEK